MKYVGASRVQVKSEYIEVYYEKFQITTFWTILIHQDKRTEKRHGPKNSSTVPKACCRKYYAPLIDSAILKVPTVQ
jgi:hypothetical protein